MKSSQPVTVIFHRADYDGLFCREIAYRFFEDNAKYIGWDYGDEKIDFPSEGQVYVLDLSPDCFKSTPAHTERMIWIDHHKTAIEKFNPGIVGYRIDGVAACRLAWQYFFSPLGPMNPNLQEPDYCLPSKEDYIERRVAEPLSVRLAGEYDIWDHRDEEADVAFQFGLDCQPFIPWEKLLRYDAHGLTSDIVADGRKAMACYAKRDAEIMRHRSFIVDFEETKFLALNTARCNSKTFAERDVPETGHDGLMAFYFTGKEWSVSLYHADHNKTLDLSQIAKRYGGGGHPGACGFRVRVLPFIPST